MKKVLAAAVLVLAGSSLTACGGGGDDAPTDASKEDFCDAFLAGPFLEEAPTGKDFKAWGDKMEKVGTPKGISKSERNGFVVLLDAIDDLDDSDKAEDINDVKVSDEDDADAEAFFTYAGETCADQLTEGLPSTGTS